MKISVSWLGGEHEFDLRIGELRAIQKDCDAGPMEIFQALAHGRWRVDMPMSILRHGLMGAGMQASDARELVDRMFDAHPIGKFVDPASYILAAAIVGVEDDPVGEPEGATMTPPPES